tara:strand:+ start:391 stop:618 length:228 start_codon:yes stop_codon:yes gene_type:complete
MIIYKTEDMKMIKISLLVVGGLLVLAFLCGVVFPTFIRGFFYLLSTMMMYPLPSLVITGVALVAYVFGLWISKFK